MDPEPLQVDFKSPWKPERMHGRFDFGHSCLILDGSRSICPMSELPFEVSQSTMQSVYAANIQPSVKTRREAEYGNQHDHDRNDKENDSIEQ